MSDFDLDAILLLGQLDQKIIGLRRRHAGANSLAAPQRDRVAKVKRELEVLAEETKAGAKEVKRLELLAKTKEAEIEKSTVALNSAKDNEAYQELLRRIEVGKADLEGIETGVLEAYEAQEERDARKKAGQERLAGQEKELAEASARVKANEAKLQAEIDELSAQRDEVSKRVSEKHLELYTRLLERLGNSAVAEVEGETCLGCSMKIRPEQVSLVRGRNFVTCSDCGRILYGNF